MSCSTCSLGSSNCDNYYYNSDFVDLVLQMRFKERTKRKKFAVIAPLEHSSSEKEHLHETVQAREPSAPPVETLRPRVSFERFTLVEAEAATKKFPLFGLS